ncbi:MAG: gamma-glutamyltransferase, partial [Chloroflexia bacterium]
MGEKRHNEYDEAGRDNTDNAVETGSEEARLEQVTRREFMRRTALTLGGAVAASSLFPSLGCDTASPDATSIVLPNTLTTPPNTPPPSPSLVIQEPTATVTAVPSTTTPTNSPTNTPTPQPTPVVDVLPPMDLTTNPYSTQRKVVIAPNGVVATSTPLAVQAGLLMLKKGGNAVDAALAAAIASTVVEPTSNGIGSDAFALVWDPSDKKLHGLNGSGRAPGALTLKLLRDKGYKAMPENGWLPVTVPGAPALWRDLHARFGKLPFASLFEPAIDYAENGFRVSPIVAYFWNRAVPIYSANKGPAFKGWLESYAPKGRAPRSGEVWSSKALGMSLRRIADSKADDFYKGDLARQIARFAAQTGGLITERDLAAHTSTWVDPISTTYRGYEAWEMPPNGQGITALIGLNILEGFELDQLKRDST